MYNITETAIYYAIIISGSALLLAGCTWLFWWSIGIVIKMLGYWPLFYKTMMRVAYERNTGKKFHEKEGFDE